MHSNTSPDIVHWAPKDMCSVAKTNMNCKNTHTRLRFIVNWPEMEKKHCLLFLISLMVLQSISCQQKFNVQTERERASFSYPSNFNACNCNFQEACKFTDTQVTQMTSDANWQPSRLFPKTMLQFSPINQSRFVQTEEAIIFWVIAKLQSPRNYSLGSKLSQMRVMHFTLTRCLLLTTCHSKQRSSYGNCVNCLAFERLQYNIT